jgi:phenylacetate-coenzyme A ligase PaaK-like adenylate-forming protein
MAHDSIAGLAARATYQRIRAAHLDAVHGALEDHAGRLTWSREQIERYQKHRLGSLLAYARERSPFHARRLGGIDPDTASVADLASIPIMTKRDAQDNWDAIVTVPDLSRDRAERILAEQQWFSYTPGNQQIFSSGGSSGVRGVYAWDWPFFISASCLAWRMQARDERGGSAPTRLAVLTADMPPHASTPLFDIPTAPGMETVVIPAGAPFDEVLAVVAATRPTHLVGYATVIGRLARAALDGDLAIRPVRVSTNSEPLLDEDRHAIHAAWDVPVHNLWARPRSGCRRWAAGVARACTCARTRWCSNVSTTPVRPWPPMSPPRGHSQRVWPT